MSTTKPQIIYLQQHRAHNRDAITDAISGICAVTLFFLLFFAAYIAAPAQPSTHSETTYQAGRQ